MKLIVILISLIVLRYMQFARTTNRYCWFQKYAAWVQKSFKKIQQPWLLTAIILLPILIVALLLQLSLAIGFFYIIGFIFSVLVLWYCLWPVSLREQVDSSLVEQQSVNDQSDSETKEEDAVSSDDHDTHVLTEILFCNANTYTFAVLFWYVVLGPLGAILYRMILQLTKLSSHPNDAPNGIVGVAHTLENLLDWIPARLVGLSYVLAGNFVKGFPRWIHYFRSGLDSNQDLLIASGFGAADIDPKADGDAEEAYQVLRMVDRALIVWLIVIAILTLGKLIY